MSTVENGALLGGERSSGPLFTRLAAMMFLQYFVQGAYLPIASVYVQEALGFTSWQVGWFSAALAVGPIIAPFFVGQIVDRFFATERVMAICHLVGGILMLLIAVQTEFVAVLVLGTAYSILYVPTMMLTNAVAFRHLRDSELEFPWIRLFGTLGYIFPAFLIEWWFLRGLEGQDLQVARGVAFTISGVVGIVMAIYCLTLPRTPPARQQQSYAPGIVVRMLQNRDFLVLVLVSFFIAIAHNFILVWYSPFMKDILDTGGEAGYEQTISSVGQICEIAVLAGLGFLLKQLGFKWTLLIGATAYMTRCLLFALVFYLDPPFAGKVALAAVGQGLHGLCFGCFLAVAYMYVDRIAPLDVRGSMQTLYGVFVVSLGFFAGGIVGGEVGERLQTPGAAASHDWTGIWLTCAAICAGCVLALAIFFPNREPQRARVERGPSDQAMDA